MITIFRTMKWVLHITLILILIFTTTSCNNIYYTKLRYADVEPHVILKKNSKSEKRISTVYLHFVDDSSTIYLMQTTHASDTSIEGVIMNHSSNDVLSYYNTLKEKAGVDSTSRMNVYSGDKKKNLNQIHLWLIDKEKFEMNKSYRIHNKEIWEMEKVQRFNKRLLWLIIGLPIFLLLGLLIIIGFTTPLFEYNPDPADIKYG